MSVGLVSDILVLTSIQEGPRMDLVWPDQWKDDLERVTQLVIYELRKMCKSAPCRFWADIFLFFRGSLFQIPLRARRKLVTMRKIWCSDEGESLVKTYAAIVASAEFPEIHTRILPQQSTSILIFTMYFWRKIFSRTQKVVLLVAWVL